MLQLLPGAGRLRVPQLAQVEVLCDAEDVLIWSVAVTPAIESLKIWEFDCKMGGAFCQTCRHARTIPPPA
jgi:phosphopantetheinyl transferase